MIKIIKLTSALVIFALASGSQADDFSYTYIEGGMNHYDDNDIEHSIEVIGSIALDERIHLFAGHNQTKFEIRGYRYNENVTARQYQIGIGAHFPTSPKTDLFIEAGALQIKSSPYGISETGFSLDSGIRHKINDKLEGKFGLQHLHVDKDLSETSVNVGGRLHLNQNISAGLDYSIGEGDGQFRSSLRLGTL